MRIYWANAIFTEADREYNHKSVSKLRSIGFEVISPQEFSLNDATENPNPIDVFRKDTAAILQSDALVACLDSETIDAGVACEIGIAYSSGIPVIGLYTDFRQYRRGVGRMYKNLYILGCLRTPTCKNIDELINSLNLIKPHSSQIKKSATHFDTIAENYETFISRLEGWYQPPWHPLDRLENILSENYLYHFLDIGCGSGGMYKELESRVGEKVLYLGYDSSSQMVKIAGSRVVFGAARARFTDDWSEVLRVASGRPFNIILASFVLHDNENLHSLLQQWSQIMNEDTRLIIIDLMRDDLSSITSILRKELALPTGTTKDLRLSPVILEEAIKSAGLVAQYWFFDCPSISFPNSTDLDAYFNTFGIYAGMDLPLDFGSKNSEFNRCLTRSIIERWTWPFQDRRAFLTCVLKKLK